VVAGFFCGRSRAKDLIEFASGYIIAAPERYKQPDRRALRIVLREKNFTVYRLHFFFYICAVPKKTQALKTKLEHFCARRCRTGSALQRPDCPGMSWGILLRVDPLRYDR
jgi:hypothetical protein